MSRGSHGYGNCKRGATAHRASYEQHIGAIPDGLHVLHRCDNRSCVNPEHLFLGTNRDNIEDCVSKGRMIGSPGLGGERNPYAKLTADQVREIRASNEPRKVLAARYAVALSNIRMIQNGQAWKHL